MCYFSNERVHRPAHKTPVKRSDRSHLLLPSNGLHGGGGFAFLYDLFTRTVHTDRITGRSWKGCVVIGAPNSKARANALSAIRPSIVTCPRNCLAQFFFCVIDRPGERLCSTTTITQYPRQYAKTSDNNNGAVWRVNTVSDGPAASGEETAYFVTTRAYKRCAVRMLRNRV